MRFAAVLFLLLAPVVFGAEWKLLESRDLPAPGGLAFREVKITNGTDRATIHEVSFAPKTHTFAVMDNPQGDFDLGTACAKRGALAGVNGGYFAPDKTPLGLVVRQGVTIHPQEKGKLLSGIVSAGANGVAIQRAGAFKLTPAVRDALQAGPFLIENGKKIAGLNATKGAARTVVFQDAKGRAGFLLCRSVTLAEMADVLASEDIFPAGKITRALNLDGGSSSALWVRSDSPFYLREWKSVRNYLAIVPR